MSQKEMSYSDKTPIVDIKVVPVIDIRPVLKPANKPSPANIALLLKTITVTSH